MTTYEFDKDLRSIQQARRLVERCRQAQREFASMPPSKVDAICEAIANAAYQESERLGLMAHEETKYGNPIDKKLKNQHASKGVWESISALKTAGIIARDEVKKVVTIAEPMGVIAALTPSTNPTSTAIFKSLIAIKARNGIVISPHPSAAKSTAEAVRVIREAAEKAGAPEGLIACLEEPTLAGTDEIMRHYAVNVILATGGGPMVRAAHSVGKPAYGVGPGNVPVWVDRSADVAKASKDLVASKSFDCSLICATEQTIVADKEIATQLRAHLEELGAFWLDEQQSDLIAKILFNPDGSMNAKNVGKTAKYLAELVGIQVPNHVKVLVSPLKGIGKEYPLSHEKLTSVMGFMTAEDEREGLDLCHKILKYGGDGHTAVIHSKNEEQVERMALGLPAFRIVVNSMSTLGSVGYTSGLMPSFTLGTGGIGGAISGDNITVNHLINYKRIGWELKSIHPESESHSTGAISSSTIDEIVRQVLQRLKLESNVT